MKKLALFASGSGTNAENIIKYFKNHASIVVDIVFSNRIDAYVLERAKNSGVDSMVFNRIEFYQTDLVLNELKNRKIDYIILAGFLWLIPENILRNFTQKIINIHPALLPNYGGKGMYGMKVHETVIQNKEKKSGISIHYVNDKYDEGEIIFQATCEIDETDTPESLANKIHVLEYRHFPSVIEKLILSNLS